MKKRIVYLFGGFLIFLLIVGCSEQKRGQTKISSTRLTMPESEKENFMPDEVRIFVDIGTTNEELNKLEEKLTKIEYFKSVTLYTKDEALEDIKRNDSNWKQFEGDSSPLYDSYNCVLKNEEVSYSELEKIISGFENVFKVEIQ